MPVERFYLEGELKGMVHLEGVEHHHLAHVLRVRIGEELELINGRGDLAKAKLVDATKREAILRIESVSHTEIPSPKIILGVPFMRMAKLEWVIEKGTELGAHAFCLYAAKYSEKGEFSEHQIQRLCHIAISAMKQCGRLDLPQIAIRTFEELTAHPSLYFGDVEGTISPIKTFPALFISGPERGFSPEERTELKKKGAALRLHPNILRAETAPIAAACLFSYFSAST